MLIATGLTIIIVVTLATGFFVALEFAYVAVDRTRLLELAEGDGPKALKARRALKICSRLSFTLSGAQLGITVTTLFVGFFAEPYLGQGLAALFGTTGIPTAVSLAVAVIIAFIIANVVQMIIGELGPKNLAIARAETVALALSRPTQWYLLVAGPLIWFFDTMSTKLLRLIGIQPVEELENHATPADLHHIIDTSRDEGSLDETLSELLDRGLDFTEIVAEQAMTPRVAVQTLDAADTVADAVEALRQGRSRFPVVGEDVDDIIGVVGIGQVLTVPRHERDVVPVADIAQPTLLIPGSLPLPTLLERMRSEHRQLACVVDEYGGFAGIVTLEDIAEELVGEIRDEEDRFEAVPVSLAGGAWLIPGRWRIDEIADATGVQLPEGEHYETISGLFMQEMGRVARPGDRVYIDTYGQAGEPPVPVQLVVVSTSRHVPQAVELRPVRLTGEGGGNR
ncbi:hemolysin family protein [Natronoglycomyces albus]|uniref:HlyC/CorC family transporter n=1 Tax=Natronoglycomyces albus TaxID=2811108 RepID=A0A895XIB2_9ACTN|nr:hemolysin family protein [Natronoglycomyces albus]QSB05551.1 HlyC/CorC family transporter [Natronoglycomyces albus]